MAPAIFTAPRSKAAFTRAQSEIAVRYSRSRLSFYPSTTGVATLQNARSSKKEISAMGRRPIAVQVSIIIFGLVVSVTSAWAAHEKVLHNFDSGDGASPFGALLFDASGNLYSTTLGGGIHDFGTAFELVPAEGGG